MWRVLIFLLAMGTTCLGQFLFRNPGFVASLTPPPAAGGAPTYLRQQTFEGAGYDNGETWTETGTVDEDFTGTVLEGSQSLLVSNSTSSVEFAYNDLDSAIGDIWMRFQFRPISLPTNVTRIANFRSTGGAAVVAEYFISATGTLGVRSGNSGLIYTSDNLSAGTTYIVWMSSHTGTGADSDATVRFASDGVFPDGGGMCATNNLSNATDDAIRTYIGVSSATDHAFIYDSVYIDDEAIGDAP